MARGMIPTDLFHIQWVSDARLSPDGRLVAFTITRLDKEADDYRAAIWLGPADGSTPPRRFTGGAGKDSAPRWAPDGTRLAFLSDREGGKAQIYVIDVTGGEARQLSAIPQGAGAPVRSPDGTRLVTVVRMGDEDNGSQQDKPKTPPARLITRLKYRANGEGFIYDRRRHLFVIDVVTGATRQLTDGDWDDTQPAWAPDGGRLAFVSARHHDRDHDHAEDIFVVDTAGGEPMRLTPGGGACALPAWSPDGQAMAYLGYAVQAGAGYVVIGCNPRGSSGREEAFARAIIGCPGEPDSADVLSTLDEALRRYDFIDSTRLGLLGGSYGGYLTGWIVGHTDRFVAAAPGRGLYNRYSKDGTSDIWSGYTYLRVRQWEDPELYWRYSPMAYVRNIRTPLLILHSEEDLRCPIEQAEQLFVALKQMRREVRFVRFPGENHELSRSGKPSHRLQRFGYLLDWFAEKLAAPAEPGS